jgi:hypothetical protein
MICPKCSGTGKCTLCAAQKSDNTCPHCSGTGKIAIHKRKKDGNPKSDPSLCNRCGGSLRGKEVWGGAHRIFPDCMETIQCQFAEFSATGRVPIWYTGPDPRTRLGQLVDSYASSIDEKQYPDAVAALLRFRSALLTGQLAVVSSNE